MALKHFKPTTPSLRQLVIVDRSDLYKGKPVKALTEGKSSKGGRNNYAASRFVSGVVVTSNRTASSTLSVVRIRGLRLLWSGSSMIPTAQAILH
jgi:ribosomal protein L2